MSYRLKSIIILKMIAVSLSVIALVFISCSSGGGDKPDEAPMEITGESALRVINISEWDTTVYFDGSYIGIASAASHRDWNVPVGSHVVRVDNAEKDQSEASSFTINFEKGIMSILTVDWIER